MSLASDFPYIAQWVSYHGKMTISQIGETTIEVALADAGGVPEDGRFHGVTADEALAKANKVLPGWLTRNKALLDSLVSGEMKSTDIEFLRVAGWPAVNNPFYAPA